MRACLRIGSVFVWIAFVLTAPLGAQAPAPRDAQPPNGASLDPPPTTPREQRNWLLARLIVDRHLGGEQVSAAQRKLAAMTPDQLDVLVRVYQERRGEQAAAAATELSMARENLDNSKQTRDALAGEVQSLRVYRQRQYLTGPPPIVGYGAAGFSGFGYGGFGYGGGYGVGGFGVYPNYGLAPFYGGFAGPGYGFGYPAYGGSVSGFGVGVY